MRLLRHLIACVPEYLNLSTSGTGVGMIPLALFYFTINLVDLVPLTLEGALLIVYMIRKRREKRVLREQIVYFLVFMLTLLWIAIAARPAHNHMYFQCRDRGVTLFAGIIFWRGTAFPVSRNIEEL